MGLGPLKYPYHFAKNLTGMTSHLKEIDRCIVYTDPFGDWEIGRSFFFEQNWKLLINKQS